MPGRFRPTRQRAAVGLTTAAVAVFAAMAGFIGLGGKTVAHATQCATGDGGGAGACPTNSSGSQGEYGLTFDGRVYGLGDAIGFAGFKTLDQEQHGSTGAVIATTSDGNGFYQCEKGGNCFGEGDAGGYTGFTNLAHFETTFNPSTGKLENVLAGLAVNPPNSNPNGGAPTGRLMEDQAGRVFGDGSMAGAPSLGSNFFTLPQMEQTRDASHPNAPLPAGLDITPDGHGLCEADSNGRVFCKGSSLPAGYNADKVVPGFAGIAVSMRITADGSTVFVMNSIGQFFADGPKAAAPPTGPFYGTYPPNYPFNFVHFAFGPSSVGGSGTGTGTGTGTATTSTSSVSTSSGATTSASTTTAAGGPCTNQVYPNNHSAPTFEEFVPTGSGGSGLTQVTVDFTGTGSKQLAIGLFPTGGENDNDHGHGPDVAPLGTGTGTVPNASCMGFRDAVRNSGTGYGAPESDIDNGVFPRIFGSHGAETSFPDNLADDICDSGEDAVFIAAVDGQTPPAGPKRCVAPTDYTATGDTLTVQVNSLFINSADGFFIAVWDDSSGPVSAQMDGELDLISNGNGAPYKAPSQLFGVSGPIIFHGPEEPIGNHNDFRVIYEDTNPATVPSGSLAVLYGDAGNGYWYRIKSSDTTNYDNDFGSHFFGVTPATWVTWTTPGDNVEWEQCPGGSEDSTNCSYGGAGGPSVSLMLDDGNPGDYPGTPWNVTASGAGSFIDPSDGDDPESGNPADDVKVSWNAPNPLDGLIATYIVSAVDSGGNDFDVCKVTPPAASGVQQSKTFCVWDPPSDSTFTYRVAAESQNSSFSDFSQPSAPTAFTGPIAGPKAGPPFSTAVFVQDTDSSGTVNTGDVLSIHFDEPMKAPSTSPASQFTVCDNTGDDDFEGFPPDNCGTIIDGTNSSWSINSTGLIMTITMTSAPSPFGFSGPVTIPFQAEKDGNDSPNGALSDPMNMMDADGDGNWDVTGSSTACDGSEFPTGEACITFS